MEYKWRILTILLSLFFNYVCSSDITHLVFGGFTDGMPAAFGDFNSDELTDVFVLLGTTYRCVNRMNHF